MSYVTRCDIVYVNVFNTVLDIYQCYVLILSVLPVTFIHLALF